MFTRGHLNSILLSMASSMRNSCCSILLKIISTDYFADAEKLLNCFHVKSRDQFGEQYFSFSANLTHMPWLFKFLNFFEWFLPFFERFKSENCLLQTKISGTVHHLPLLVEHYQSKKQSVKASVSNDNLIDFCHQFQARGSLMASYY